MNQRKTCVTSWLLDYLSFKLRPTGNCLIILNLKKDPLIKCYPTRVPGKKSLSWTPQGLLYKNTWTSCNKGKYKKIADFSVLRLIHMLALFRWFSGYRFILCMNFCLNILRYRGNSDFSPRNSPILPIIKYNLVHQLRTPSY